MKKFFTLIRVLNRDGDVSLTNLLVLIMVVSSFFGTVPTIVFLSVAGMYVSSRWINFLRGQVVDKATLNLLKNQEALQKQINEINAKLTGLHVKAGIKGADSGITQLRRF